MLHGVNYASAGAGIIFSSGSELVCFLCLSLVIMSNFIRLVNQQISLKQFDIAVILLTEQASPFPVTDLYSLKMRICK